MKTQKGHEPHATWLDAAVESFPNTNHMLPDHVSFGEAHLGAKRELQELRRTVNQLDLACKAAVVYSVEGYVDGKPTSTLNYLQRLRAMRALELACMRPTILRMLPAEQRDYLMEQGANVYVEHPPERVE